MAILDFIEIPLISESVIKNDLRWSGSPKSRKMKHSLSYSSKRYQKCAFFTQATLSSNKLAHFCTLLFPILDGTVST